MVSYLYNTKVKSVQALPEGGNMAHENSHVLILVQRLFRGKLEDLFKSLGRKIGFHFILDEILSWRVSLVEDGSFLDS